MLSSSWSFVAALDYPRFIVHVLDDGAQDAVKTLAAAYGFNCEQAYGRSAKGPRRRPLHLAWIFYLEWPHEVLDQLLSRPVDAPRGIHGARLRCWCPTRVPTSLCEASRCIPPWRRAWPLDRTELLCAVPLRTYALPFRRRHSAGRRQSVEKGGKPPARVLADFGRGCRDLRRRLLPQAGLLARDHAVLGGPLYRYPPNSAQFFRRRTEQAWVEQGAGVCQ